MIFDVFKTHADQSCQKRKIHSVLEAVLSTYGTILIIWAPSTLSLFQNKCIFFCDNKTMISFSLKTLFTVLMATGLVHAADVNVGPDIWRVPSGDSLPAMSSEVGSTITFEWTGSHNVLIHPSGTCDGDQAIFLG